MKNKLIKSLITLSITTLALTACQENTKQQPAAKERIENPISFNNIALNKVTATDLPHYLSRNIQDEVFYFVMPDRFYNGDTSNDLGSKTQPISAGGLDKTHKGMFHGGDIKGLQQKLPYLKEMGISAIWMTPILRNKAMQADTAGYHGYWVLDFTEIDPHFGSNDDLKSFIDAAHKENIKIFFDIITNHTADVIKYTECHGEDGTKWLVGDKGCTYKSLAQKANGDVYTPIIPAGEEQVKTPAWLNNIDYYHNQGDTTFEGENSVYGDFAGLDDIDTDNPEVVKLMTQTFKALISEFKPDGFRIDTVKHVNVEFWTEFAPALVNHAQAIGIPEFFMFGEVYDGDENSKLLSLYTTTGKMQSVLDFGFQSMTQNAVIKQQGTDSIDNWLQRDIDFKDEDSDANQLLNFTGNHDMGRFAHMVRRSEFNYSEDEQIKRNLLASAMMYFMRGIPIVYYGDEQGFVGDGGDQDSRQDMMPSQVASYNDDNLLATDATTADNNFDQTHLFYQAYADFANVYHQVPALRHGEQQTLYKQDKPGIYALSRTIEGDNKQQVIVAFNTAKSKQALTLDITANKLTLLYSSTGDDIQGSFANNKLTSQLPAFGYAVWQVNY